MSQSGLALRFASAELRADCSVVMRAIRQDGYALRFASEELRERAEVVTTAVAQTPRAIQFASEALLADQGFVMNAVAIDHRVVEWVSASVTLPPALLYMGSGNKYASKYADDEESTTSGEYSLGSLARLGSLGSLDVGTPASVRLPSLVACVAV